MVKRLKDMDEVDEVLQQSHPHSYEYYMDDTKNVVVTVAKPKAWGEGYAIEQAVRALKQRYYQIMGKELKV